MRQNGEPSVEEILQSIKHVIARDTRDAVRNSRSDKPRAEATREVPSNETAPLDSTPAFRPLDYDVDGLGEDILDLAQEAEVSAEEEMDERTAQDMAMQDHDGDDERDEPSLIQPRMRASMRDSLAALAMLSESGAAPKIVRSGETSLEDLTRELLRPALTEWLEANLPQLVERMVAAEIARIVGKKG